MKYIPHCKTRYSSDKTLITQNSSNIILHNTQCALISENKSTWTKPLTQNMTLIWMSKSTWSIHDLQVFLTSNPPVTLSDPDQSFDRDLTLWSKLKKHNTFLLSTVILQSFSRLLFFYSFIPSFLYLKSRKVLWEFLEYFCLLRLVLWTSSFTSILNIYQV